MNFQEIALPNFQALYNFALRLTRHTEDAEDLVQETYLRAYRKFDQFDYATSIKSWMFKIMHNIAVDQSRKRDSLFSAGPEGCEDLRCGRPVLQDSVISSIDLKKALSLMQDQYRLPVLLKDMEGFSYQEIAGILNLPMGTVMSRLYRGRKELLGLLSDSPTARQENKIVFLKKNESL